MKKQTLRRRPKGKWRGKEKGKNRLTRGSETDDR